MQRPSACHQQQDSCTSNARAVCMEVAAEPFSWLSALLQLCKLVPSSFVFWAEAGGRIDQISDMGDAKLLKTVERWLRTERSATRKTDNDQSVSEKKNSSPNCASTQQEKAASKPAPYFPSRHMAYFH